MTHPEHGRRHRGIVGATIEGIRGRLSRNRSALETDTDLTGRCCLVTGANSGLGKGIAIRLASRGAEVVMAGRTMDEAARQDICRQSGSTQVRMEKLDLALFDSVWAFVDRCAARSIRFDGVVLNAAVVTPKSRLTGDGQDEMMQVNFLSNVLLTERLLSADCLSSWDGDGPRIVVISSEAHRWSEGIDLETLGQQQAFSMSKSMRQYADTKFLMAAWTAHLARRLEGRAAVHALCPGAVNTNIARQAPAMLQPLLRGVFAVFFASPQTASAPVVHLLSAPCLRGRTGLYYHMEREKAFDPRAADPGFGAAVTARLMELMVEIRA